MNKKILIIIGIILLIIMIYISSLSKTKPPASSPSPTPIVDNQPNATESAIQTPNDLKYAKAQEDLILQYPWYPKLPIETADFRIIYDFDKDSFRIRLLTQSSETIKQNAINEIKSIGVNLAKFTYYFIEP
jgi:hypothetical protein